MGRKTQTDPALAAALQPYVKQAQALPAMQQVALVRTIAEQATAAYAAAKADLEHARAAYAAAAAALGAARKEFDVAAALAAPAVAAYARASVPRRVCPPAYAVQYLCAVLGVPQPVDNPE
jgi:hypothetical protein